MRWLWEKALEGIYQYLVVLAAIGVALLLWKYVHHDLTLPIWAFAAAVGIPSLLAVGLVVSRTSGRRRESIETVSHEIELQGEMLDLESTNERLEAQAALIAYYANHLVDVLQSLQRVVAGTIPGVTLENFVEHGVLQPARDFLMQRAGEDIRLSVLVPAGDRFKMKYAAGHSLESRQRFSLRIADSFSRIPYETGEIAWSGDLESDPRFTRHPSAGVGREYSSIISVPIRSGDKTVAVFNVISTFRDAFEPADFIYVRLIGAVIELVMTMPRFGAAT